MRAEYAFHSPFWDDISDSGIDVFPLIFALVCEQVLRSQNIVIIISSSILKVTCTLQLGLNPVDKPLFKCPSITSPHIHFVPVDFICSFVLLLCWCHTSTAKDFIGNMMEKNPTKRFSTDQALKHPWLVSHGQNSSGTRVSSRVLTR